MLSNSRVCDQRRGSGCPYICNRSVHKRDDFIFYPFDESQNVSVAKINHACPSET